MTDPATATAWLDHLLEPGHIPLFDDVVGGDPLGFPGYAAQLERAREATGCSESVLVAEGIARGTDLTLVVIAFEFGFLGGSMGTAAGERICRAFEHAAARGLPVLALTASGGARMQEGMHALAQMPATVAARRHFARSGRPFAAYLRHPTTGGVFASFASTADLIWAEPGATIGFAGPRVAEALGGEPLDGTSHTAEAARDAGLVDRVASAAEVGELIALLATVTPARATTGTATAEPPAWTPSPSERAAVPPRPDASAYDLVTAARDPARRAIDWLPVTQPLRSGATVRCGIAQVEDRHVVAIAMDASAPLSTGGLRGARRAIEIAQRLGLPIVTVVHTPGADPRAASERAGIAREIAATFDALLAATVPTVACVTGEGGSGGALSLAACDRVLICDRAVFSVIAPEGAASILRREDVDGVAADLRPTAHDLLDLGLADMVVAEPAGGAPADPLAARASLHEAIASALDDIALEGAPSRARSLRWRVLR